MPSLCIYTENGLRCRNKAGYAMRGEKKTHCCLHKTEGMISSVGRMSPEEALLKRRTTRLSQKTVNDYQQQLIDAGSTIVLVGIISAYLTDNAGTNAKMEAYDTKCVHRHGTFCDTNLHGLFHRTMCPRCANEEKGRKAVARALQYSSCADNEHMRKVWVPSNTPITEVPLHSNSLIDYICITCGHYVKNIQVNNLYTAFEKENFGCRFCNNPSKFLCDDLDCAVCRPNRMSSLERVVKCLVRIIDYDGTLDTLRKCAKIKIELKCDTCNHLFQAACSDLSRTDGGDTWCPYCSSPPKRMCGCTTCIENSLASFPHVVENWSDRNTKRPHEIFIGATEKVWLVCTNPECNEHYEVIPYLINRCGGNNCTVCYNKTVQLIVRFLTDVGYTYKLEFSFEKRTRTTKRYDIVVLREGRILLFIEVDGPHHFEATSYRGMNSTTDYDNVFESDVEKMRVVLDKGYSMLRIIQEDVWYGRVDYKSLIVATIKHAQHTPSIFFQESNKYHAHKMRVPTLTLSQPPPP